MRISFYTACCLLLFTIQNIEAQKRQLKPADIYRAKRISDIQVSPEGNWITYTMMTVDSARDRSHAAIWMINWEGTKNIQLTNSDEGENTARWSPDGNYLSFLSSRRSGEEGTQLWLMDRAGGEAQKKTSIKGEIEQYVWRPDGKKILLVIKDPDYADTAKNKPRKPYVIDRYHFKEDVQGYLDRRHSHLYLFDPETKKLDTLTKGNFDESSPGFSPDGQQVVFESNHTDEPDRNENTDLWLMTVSSPAKLQQLTNWSGSDSRPQWSPDGKYIAYLRSSGNEPFLMYGQEELALIKPGTEPVILSQKLDRPVNSFQWSSNSQSIFAIVSDDRENYSMLFSLDGSMKKISDPGRSLDSWNCGKSGKSALLISDPQWPKEIYAYESEKYRRISHIQDSFMAPLKPVAVKGFQSTSKDGTLVSGFVFLPDSAAGKKFPTIFFIHGGPVSQDDYGFDITRQILAGSGFAVAAVNYRGSNGRGIAFTKSIFGDWGHKEVMDILGAADYLVKQNIADPERLGIGGWSYGGILTDYCIASDTRFKAAASGAGSALQLTMYGIDQYTNQYENELGPPWKNINKWLALSYPFFHADKIQTPTLFMASQSDFNVPVAGAEQMYQALKSMGVQTQLVIYPKQFHSISVPGYQVDRLNRYIEWFTKYLKK